MSNTVESANKDAVKNTPNSNCEKPLLNILNFDISNFNISLDSKYVIKLKNLQVSSFIG